MIMTRDEALGIIDEKLRDLELANPDIPGVPIFVLIDDEKNTTLYVVFEDKAIENIVVAYDDGEEEDE